MYDKFPNNCFSNPNYVIIYNMMLPDTTFSICMMCPLLYYPYRAYLSGPCFLLSQQKSNYYRDNASINADSHTTATIKALVDAIIPRTSELTQNLII